MLELLVVLLYRLSLLLEEPGALFGLAVQLSDLGTPLLDTQLRWERRVFDKIQIIR